MASIFIGEIEIYDGPRPQSPRDEPQGKCLMTIPIKREWIHNENPTVKGWYAVTICWDVQEGLIPSALLWDGESWSASSPIMAFCGPFVDESTAIEWAYENDIEGCL